MRRVNALGQRLRAVVSPAPSARVFQLRSLSGGTGGKAWPIKPGSEDDVEATGRYNLEIPGLSVRFAEKSSGMPFGNKSVNFLGIKADQCCWEIVTGAGFPINTIEGLLETPNVEFCGMTYTIASMAHLFGTPPRPGVIERTSSYVDEIAAALDGSKEAATSRGSQLHIHATLALLNNNPSLACSYWESILLENPFDALALRCAQATYLLGGDSRNALACVERVLAMWQPSMPHFNAVLGMHALGLAENGFISQAEEVAGSSLSGNQEVILATQAAGTVLLDTARFREGLRLLRELNESYEDMRAGVPTSSHAITLEQMQCAFHLEPAKVDFALTILDQKVMIRSPEISFTNAAAMLWRLKLVGVSDELLIREYEMDVENTSWFEVAPKREEVITFTSRVEQYSDVAASATPDLIFPFVNIMKVAIHVMLGDLEMGRALVKKMENVKVTSLQDKGITSFPSTDPAISFQSSPLLSPTDVVEGPCVNVSTAFLAIGNGDFEKAADLLLKERANFSSVSGGRIGNDVLEQTLLYALLRACNIPSDFITTEEDFSRAIELYEKSGSDSKHHHYVRKTRSLLNEHCMRRHLSPRAWDFHSRLMILQGDEDTSRSSSKRSLDLGHLQGGAGAH